MEIKQRNIKVTIANPMATVFNLDLPDIEFDVPDDFFIINEYSEDYNKIRAELEQRPDYIKETYNDNFAISKHAKKIPLSDEKTYQEINTLMDIWQKYEDGKLIEVVRCKDCDVAINDFINGKLKRYCRLYDEWMPLEGYCHVGYIEDEE